MPTKRRREWAELRRAGWSVEECQRWFGGPLSPRQTDYQRRWRAKKRLASWLGKRNARVMPPASVSPAPMPVGRPANGVPQFDLLVGTYGDLIRALQDRREQLGVTQAELDAITGAQSGYTGKVEVSHQAKGRSLGRTSLDLYLAGTGLQLAVVSDPTGAALRLVSSVQVGAKRRGPPPRKGAER